MNKDYGKEWWIRYIYSSIILFCLGSHLGTTLSELFITLVMGLIYFLWIFQEKALEIYHRNIIEIYHSLQIKYWKWRLHRLQGIKLTFTIGDIKIINKILFILMMPLIVITLIIGLIYTASMYFGMFVLTWFNWWFFNNLEIKK